MTPSPPLPALRRLPSRGGRLLLQQRRRSRRSCHRGLSPLRARGQPLGAALPQTRRQRQRRLPLTARLSPMQPQLRGGAWEAAPLP